MSLNGQCLITSTNLPLLFPFPFLPFTLSSFAPVSEIIYSNPLVMMMVVPVAVMQITAVGVFLWALHVMSFISHSILLYNGTTVLHKG